MRQVFKALSLGAPRLTGRLVERFFFTPCTYVPSADEKRRLEHGEQFHVRAHGRRIYGWRWGNGGVVAHSSGAAAVVNALTHQKVALKAVLLAPALHLRKTLFDALERHGIAPRVYEKIIAAYEAHFGYSLERDDPHRLLGDLRSPVLVIHDLDDPVIAHGDSEALCGRIGHVTLKTTSGLGHRKIMSDPDVVEAGVSHLLQDQCDAPAAGTFGERGTAPSSPLRGIGRERHATR